MDRQIVDPDPGKNYNAAISAGDPHFEMEKIKLKIQQLLVEAEFKDDQLVANHMASLWPGQFANASVCCHRH